MLKLIALILLLPGLALAAPVSDRIEPRNAWANTTSTEVGGIIEGYASQVPLFTLPCLNSTVDGDGDGLVGEEDPGCARYRPGHGTLRPACHIIQQNPLQVSIPPTGCWVQDDFWNVPPPPDPPTLWVQQPDLPPGERGWSSRAGPSSFYPAWAPASYAPDAQVPACDNGQDDESTPDGFHDFCKREVRDGSLPYGYWGTIADGGDGLNDTQLIVGVAASPGANVLTLPVTIQVGDEQITCTVRDSNTQLSSCTRGANSTTAASHAEGARYTEGTDPTPTERIREYSEYADHTSSYLHDESDPNVGKPCDEGCAFPADTSEDSEDPPWDWDNDETVCNDQGITEIPPFCDKNDSDGCLICDPGNGDKWIPFQLRWFHLSGIDFSAVEGKQETRPAGIDYTDIGMSGNDIPCEEPDNDGCNGIVYDVYLDNWLDAVGKNDDIWNAGTGNNIEHILANRFCWVNTWQCKCDGPLGQDQCAGANPPACCTTAVTGPNGLSCAAAEDSNSHIDGIQLEGAPGDDGWIVMQSGILANGFNNAFLFQKTTPLGTMGSVMLQGVDMRRRESIGAATNWITTCKATCSDGNCDGGTEICEKGVYAWGADNRERWIVDVSMSSCVAPKNGAGVEKMVIINTGCDETGCNGTIGYSSNGWPHPLCNKSPGGPGTVTINGSAGPYNDGIPTYVYESFEEARKDHKLPPFAHYSKHGWADPNNAHPNATEMPADCTEIDP